MSFTPPPPPPPPPASPPPPPGPPPAAAPPPPPPPSFQGPATAMAGIAPRPQVRVAAALLIGGAVAHIVAVFLPWFRYRGATLNGRDDFLSTDLKVLHSPGNFWLFFGAVLLGLGLTLFFAGRQLAVAIIAVVMAALASFFSLIGIGAANDMKTFAGGGTTGIGPTLGILAALVALAGAITALAKRRR